MTALPSDAPERHEVAPRAAIAAGGLAVLIGAVVLCGWTMEIEVLKSLVPHFIVMLPATAVGFVMAGTSLVLSVRWREMARGGAIARALAVLVLGLGLVMFLQRLAAWDLGINRWLFEKSLETYSYRPVGLMAVNSGASFTLLGGSLLAIGSRTPRARRLGETLAALALFIAAGALVGYLYGVEALYSFDRYAGMALPTALGFAALAGGILLVTADQGALRVLSGPDAGAVLARRLLPAALLIPTALGWFWLTARRNEWVGRETGVSLFVVLTATIFVALVLRNALVVRRTDEARERERGDALAARATAELALRRAEDAQTSAEEARRMAEVANEAKSQFLAVMSHELRTPLNAIRGYAELLEMGVRGPLNEAQRIDLARIRQSERHLLSLIDDLLNLTQIERGDMTYAIQTMSIASVLETAAAVMAPQMRARRVVFDPIAADPALLVRADPDRVRQILLNLLSNAVKFSEPGGRVGIAIEADDSSVRIIVEDGGRGIPSEMLEAVFDPFVQGDAGHTRTTSGVGLGLAISRQLARAMHGDLTVESRLGIGSSFTLRLPRDAGRTESVSQLTPDRRRAVAGPGRAAGRSG